MSRGPKKRGCKRLLELLGADPNEEPPRSLADAREIAGMVTGHIERQVCPSSGKQCYNSESEARRAITNRLRKGSNTGALRSYLCPDCGKWHMSSSFHK